MDEIISNGDWGIYSYCIVDNRMQQEKMIAKKYKKQRENIFQKDWGTLTGKFSFEDIVAKIDSEFSDVGAPCRVLQLRDYDGIVGYLEIPPSTLRKLGRSKIHLEIVAFRNRWMIYPNCATEAILKVQKLWGENVRERSRIIFTRNDGVCALYGIIYDTKGDYRKLGFSPLDGDKNTWVNCEHETCDIDDYTPSMIEEAAYSLYKKMSRVHAGKRVLQIVMKKAGVAVIFNSMWLKDIGDAGEHLLIR